MIILTATQFRKDPATGEQLDLFLRVETKSGHQFVVLTEDAVGRVHMTNKTIDAGENMIVERRRMPRWTEEQPTLVTSQEMAEGGGLSVAVPLDGLRADEYIPEPGELLDDGEPCCSDDDDDCPSRD